MASLLRALMPLDRNDLASRAEAEVLAELGETHSLSSGTRVIGTSSSSSSQGKRRPLLLANIADEVLQARGEDEKLRTDLSLRPDHPGVSSAAYREVPVECFGAALLRGMGWTGPSDEEIARQRSEAKSEAVVPRERRLGLGGGHPLSSPCLTHAGATARPPERIRSAQDAKIREEWSRKAKERRKQELRVEDVVWLRSGEMAGMRARVEAVR